MFKRTIIQLIDDRRNRIQSNKTELRAVRRKREISDLRRSSSVPPPSRVGATYPLEWDSAILSELIFKSTVLVQEIDDKC